jgi:hypothetical protein
MLRDDPPNKLKKDMFENRLWRNGDEEAASYTDLQSEVPFPTFNNLPGDNDVSPEYLRTPDGFYYSPIKHW